MSTNAQLPSAIAARALRRAIGWSQEQVAKRAEVGRVEIVNVESGRNQATSARMRDGLARAFCLTAEQMSAALAGTLSPAEVIPIAQAAIVSETKAKAKKTAPRKTGAPSSARAA